MFFGLPGRIVPGSVEPVRHFGALLGVALAVLALQFACTAPTPSSTPPPTHQSSSAPSSTAFTVMTYNVYVANPNLTSAVRLIRDASPTVVCLQETIEPSQAVFRRELANLYPHMAFHIGKVGNGPAVLSKVPFAKPRYVSSSLGYNGYWLGEFVIHGHAVQIVNVHLHPTTLTRGGLRGVLAGWAGSEGVRSREVDEIVSLLDPELPVVLAGDFNTISSSATYQHLGQLGFVDSFREGRTPPRGTPTFRGRRHGYPVGVRLDYVFRRGPLRVERARVIRQGESDHYPVVATLAWVARGGPSLGR